MSQNGSPKASSAGTDSKMDGPELELATSAVTEPGPGRASASGEKVGSKRGSTVEGDALEAREAGAAMPPMPASTVDRTSGRSDSSVAHRKPKEESPNLVSQSSQALEQSAPPPPPEPRASVDAAVQKPPETDGTARKNEAMPKWESSPIHSVHGSGTYSPIQVLGAEGPPIAYWRPTEASDIPRILDMMTPETEALYGDAANVPYVLETSVLALTQLNVRGEVVACLCLSSWPPCPAVHPAASPDWLGELYAPAAGPEAGAEAQAGSARDPDRVVLSLGAAAAAATTLLARLLVWDARYVFSCPRLLLHSVFVTMPQLDWAVIVVPPNAMPNRALLYIFEEIHLKGLKSGNIAQSLLVCHRTTFIRPLQIRKAEYEDNDDLLQIFDQQSYRLRELYGDFYISELISNPESRQILVAEEPQLQRPVSRQSVPAESEGSGSGSDTRSPVAGAGAGGGGRAVGVVVLNTDVNLALLNSHFCLLPFYGLRQQHIRDKLNLKGWIKPRAEMVQALQEAEAVQHERDASAPTESSGTDEASSDTASSVAAPVREGLAARAARLTQEALEKKRRRWQDPERYLSSLSLTQEELQEPNDPFRLQDVDWDAGAGRASLGCSDIVPVSLEDDDEEGEAIGVPKKLWRRTKSSMLQTDVEFLPDYKGSSNAFLIELFAMSDRCDERMARCFLEAAFDMFPHLDYCALAVPHAYPTFPLLDNFVRVSPREKRNFHQELYVAHRCSLLAELKVRVAEASDLPAIYNMIRTLRRGLDVLVEEIRAAVSEDTCPWLQAYVCLCEDQVVGVAAVSDEEDVEYMDVHFHLSRFVNLRLLLPEEIGGLRLCILSPVFQQRSNYFLRELHRLTAKTVLVHALYGGPSVWEVKRTSEPDDDDDGEPDEAQRRESTPMALKGDVVFEEPPRLPVLSVFDEMVPVQPRPPPNGIPAFGAKALSLSWEENVELAPAERRYHPYALFLSTPRLEAMPRTSVNVRIVVVGASDAGLAFLEALVFGSPEVRFNNLTLVSMDGMPGETKLSPLADLFLPYRGRYNYRRLASQQLGAWVSVLQGTVTSVQRGARLIEVNGRATLPYDYLFVFGGQQFQRPCFTGGVRGAAAECLHYPDGKGRPASIGVAAPRVRFDVSSELATDIAGAGAGSQASSEVSSMSSGSLDQEEEDAEKQNLNKEEMLAETYVDTLPSNVFLVNSSADVEQALATLYPIVTTIPDDMYRVVVVGHCPEALCCLRGLLEWGVPGSSLLFVDPNPKPKLGQKAEADPESVAIFWDDEVDDAVLAALEAADVSVCRGLELEGWTEGEPDWLWRVGVLEQNAKYIMQVTLKPKEGAQLGILENLLKKDSEEDETDATAPITLNCVGLFYFGQKTPDPGLFKALVDGGLVVDARLMIDREGRTNDPFVLAGGPITSYQARMHAGDLAHVHCSSIEVGRKMAQRMRRICDPVYVARVQLEERTAAFTSSSSADADADESPSAPSSNRGSRAGAGAGADPEASSRTSQSRRDTQSEEKHVTRSEAIGAGVRAVLGPYSRYMDLVPSPTAPRVLHCALPGGLYFLSVRYPGQQQLPDEGTRSVQSGAAASKDLCRVLLDSGGFVRAVTCLSAEPLPVDIIKASYGQHEADLNGLSGDLLQFYRAPENYEKFFIRDPCKRIDWLVCLDYIFGYPAAVLVPMVSEALQSRGWKPLDRAAVEQLQQQWAQSPEQRSVERSVRLLMRECGRPIQAREARETVRDLLVVK